VAPASPPRTALARRGGALAGLTIALAWLINSLHAANSFDVIPVQSISFTGPSADTLMGLINEPSLPLTFDIGLVPGVFAGSMLAALATREFRWQRFTAESGTVRYLIGATLMGFGRDARRRLRRRCLHQRRCHARRHGLGRPRMHGDRCGADGLARGPPRGQGAGDTGAAPCSAPG
jgi:hypothetical protein